MQEDFVKWRGMLFYRFVSVLGDSDAETQKLATNCFVTLLKNKQPIMFFSHFIETIFYLNDYQDHTVYNQLPQSPQERKLFTMPGPGLLMYVHSVILPCKRADTYCIGNVSKFMKYFFNNLLMNKSSKQLLNCAKRCLLLL